MNCSFCEKDSVVSLLCIVNGDFDRKFFCKDHKKNNPIKDKYFHVMNEPEREDLVDVSDPLKKEERTRRIGGFERMLFDILKEKDDGAPLEEMEGDHNVFKEPEEYVQNQEEKSIESLKKEMLEAAGKEDFNKAAELRDEINKKSKDADDNPDLCGV